MINNFRALRLQSLWRMENDFMGGVYRAYYIQVGAVPKIIYTYLYAPGEQKRLFLLQLDAIIHTLYQN